MREANGHLTGEQAEITHEGQETIWSGIKVALVEQHFHVGGCFPMAGWESGVAAGAMKAL